MPVFLKNRLYRTVYKYVVKVLQKQIRKVNKLKKYLFATDLLYIQLFHLGV